MTTANHRGRGDDDRVEELSFDDDDNTPAKIGDPRVASGQVDEEISPQRVREAGMTGGELNRDYTDDDLSPETLFDEEHNVAGPIDKETRVVGPEEVGGGIGLDEAELALAGIKPDE